MPETTDDRLEPAEIESLRIVSPIAEPVRLRDDRRYSAQPAEHTSAGIQASITPPWELADRLKDARPFELPSFDAPENDGSVADAADTATSELELRIELGRAALSVDEADALREGAVVALDTFAGDPVDIVSDGRPIARGEVLVIDDRLCVRVSEILALPVAAESTAEPVLS